MNILAGSYIVLMIAGLAVFSVPDGKNSAIRAHNDSSAALDTSLMLVNAGRILFLAQELSSDGEVACATCHIPSRQYQDGHQTGVARFRKLLRNTPTLLNVNRYRSFFWDGRAATLHEQIMEPLLKSQVEMMSTDSIMRAFIRSMGFLDSTARRLGYGEQNARKFVMDALERYTFSIATQRTRYHDHREGRVKLTAQEMRGLRLFNGRARCATCHPAPDFTDNLYWDTGLFRQRSIVDSYAEDGIIKARMEMDYGRGTIVPGKKHLFSFRTPSLYNVELTAPYMHNGSLPTLESVIDFYDRGGDEPLAGAKPLNLTRREKQDLIAFMKTLTDVRFAEQENRSGAIRAGF